MNDEALGELLTMVRNNGKAYAGYAEKLLSRFGSTEAAEIVGRDFVAFYCLSVPKTIVSKALEKGWLVEPCFAGLHTRQREESRTRLAGTYSMLSWVGRFSRYSGMTQELGRRDTPQIADYARVIGKTTEMPVDVDYRAGESGDQVSADLRSVVALRESFGERHRVVR